MAVGVKTFTIARRKPEVSHAAVADCWRGSHAANVVEHMRPDGYTLTFFDPRDGKTPYDGMAELRYDDADRAALVTGGNIPAVVANDGWADLVQLPNVWARVTEHVIIAGPGPDGGPATADDREAAFKLTFFLAVRAGLDRDAVRAHWLDVHVPNFREHFLDSGGVRYVVNVVERSAGEDLLGIAELSYRDRACAEAHQPPDDGFRAMIELRALPGHEVVVRQ